VKQKFFLGMLLFAASAADGLKQSFFNFGESLRSR
jgi:hypothetical protein